MVPTNFIVLAAALACALALQGRAAAAQSASAASELEAVQNINLHLLNEGLELAPPASGQNAAKAPDARQLKQMGAIERALGELRAELELVRGDELLELALVDDKFATLLNGAQDAHHLRAFLETLTQLECDQVSLDFLMVLAHFSEQPSSTNDGAAPEHGDSAHLLLQNYAKLRVQQCWRQAGATIARRLDAALGKLTTPLFKFLERLALKMRALRLPAGESKPAAAAGAIRIDDSRVQAEALGADLATADVASSMSGRDANKVREMVGALKEIKLASEQDWREFALGVSKLFVAYKRALDKDNDDDDDAGPRREAGPHSSSSQFYEHFLARPCAELTARVRSVVELGAIYKNHVQQTVGQALAGEKRANERLDYELQVYRICKLAGQNNASIKRQLV